MIRNREMNSTTTMAPTLETEGDTSLATAVAGAMTLNQNFELGMVIFLTCAMIQ